jgi:hypothetical protein
MPSVGWFGSSSAKHRVGFISELRLNRALEYEPQSRTLPLAAFPKLNARSVSLDIPVHTVAFGSGFGADESDLTEAKLFRETPSESVDYTFVRVAEATAHAVCSLPLGTLSPLTSPSASGRLASVRLARSGWHREALDKIAKIDALLPIVPRPPSNDEIFEFLVAMIASRMPGCSEAWVVPRRDDQGVDVGPGFKSAQSLAML